MNKKWIDGIVQQRYFAVLKKVEGDYIICNVIMDDSQKNKRKGIYGEANAKLKLDKTNINLLEKVKSLTPRCKFYIVVQYPRIGGNHNLNTWKVIDLLDKEDILLEENNCNHLIPVAKMERTHPFKPIGADRKYSAKDIQIMDLKEENTYLKETNKGMNDAVNRLLAKIENLKDENQKLKEQIKILGGE